MESKAVKRRCIRKYYERRPMPRGAKYRAVGTTGIDYAKRSPSGRYSRERERQIASPY